MAETRKDDVVVMCPRYAKKMPGAPTSTGFHPGGYICDYFTNGTGPHRKRMDLLVLPEALIGEGTFLLVDVTAPPPDPQGDETG